MDVIDENDVVTVNLWDPGAMGVFNTLVEDVDAPELRCNLDPSRLRVHDPWHHRDCAMGSGIFEGEGIVFDSNTGILTFTPDDVAALNNLPAGGADIFTVDFTVLDDTGGPGDGDVSNQGSIIWTVTGQNDAPVFNPPVNDGGTDVFTTNEGPTGLGVIGTFDATDADMETLTYSLVGGNVGGVQYLSIDSATGEVSLIEELDFEGEKAESALSFRVAVTDGTDTVQSDVIQLNSVDVDDAPDTMDVTLNSTAGLPVTISQLADFIAMNVSDQDGEDFNLVSVQDAMGGTVVLNSNPTGNPGDDPNDNILFTPTDNTVASGHVHLHGARGLGSDPLCQASWQRICNRRAR